MAKLLEVWRSDNPATVTRRQMPLIIDENLTMIMDISGLDAVCDHPIVKGKLVEEFAKKLSILSPEEIKNSFQVPCKDMLTVLGQAVPCVGCRRSVERLFYDLMKSGHPVLDPLVITSDGVLTVQDRLLKSPQLLCTMLQGHSARLNTLVERQPRNKKSRRCTLHSLEMQRTRPPSNVWREVWDCMAAPCREEVTLVEAETLDATLENYLKKHRFCGECRTKVLLASSLLTNEREPAKEKGYVAALYSGIKRCISEHHVHLPINTEYIANLIGRAQPELMGRERHAKTLEIAQEEVLTCLGICVADRLNRVHRRLKEEETMCKVFAAVAVDALSRNFQAAVEKKQGVTQLELLYEEITREEIAKKQRREKIRLKRKKKKERRFESEEKENSYDCTCEQSGNSDGICNCAESKSSGNVDRAKLQVLDPKIKGPPTCQCSNCLEKMSENSKKVGTLTNAEEKPSEKNVSKRITTTSQAEGCNRTNCLDRKGSGKEKPDEGLEESCSNCENHEVCETSGKRKKDRCEALKGQEGVSKELVDVWCHDPSKRCLWKDVEDAHCKEKVTERNCRCSSERLSQDCGYSSEHNISSSSIPSTPDGSEVACSDSCCNHEGDCLPNEILAHSNGVGSTVGLTLSQMLKDSLSSEEEAQESYLSAEELEEFKSSSSQLLEKRKALRKKLEHRFAMLCRHQKSLPYYLHGCQFNHIKY